MHAAGEPLAESVAGPADQPTEPTPGSTADLAILYEIATLSKRWRSMEAVLDLTLDKATRLLGAEIAVLYLSDAFGETAQSDAQDAGDDAGDVVDMLQARAARGVRLSKVCQRLAPGGNGEQRAAAGAIDPNTAALVWSAASGEPLPFPDILGGYPVQAALGVPIRSGHELLGWLYAALFRRRAFAPGEVTLFNVLADQVASTLEITQTWQHNRRQQTELAATNRQLAQVLAEVRHAYAQQEHLLQTIRELSTPVLQVARQTLLVPLIGAIDAERSERVKEAMLAAIGQSQARVVIMDITGVPTVDEQVAQTLIEAARAAQLLGARVVLCGITPRVAQVVVQLGLSLHMPTANDLQTALALALSIEGLAIVPSRVAVRL